MMDRFFDNYVMTPMQRIVFDCMRPARGPRSLRRRGGAQAARDRIWLARRARWRGREWAAGGASAWRTVPRRPALFYADWAHPIAARSRTSRAYRRRLLRAPSFARAVDEARPYRALFPLGAPDRD